MTLIEDVRTLGLSSDDVKADDSQRRIRRAFLQLSLIYHPDKGGTKDGFQELSAAYYRLRAGDDRGAHDYSGENGADGANEGAEEERGEDDYNYWHDMFYEFFRRRHYWHQEYPQSDEDQQSVDVEDEFFTWEQDAYERRKAWSRHHKQEVKRGKDYRDKKAKGNADVCQFCGQNKPIKMAKAENNGIDWKGYIKSIKPRPGKEVGYNTCWVCKTNHISVLTEAMAKKKFAKKLEKLTVFEELRRSNHTFTHQPVTDFCEETRTSLYFWYPDLESAALAAGWKPRGKDKESVPWQPKDKSKRKAPSTPAISVVAVTPGSSTRTRKRRHRDDDDRKPSAKRGLEF